MNNRQMDSLFQTEEHRPRDYNHIIRVAFDAAVDNTFDYAVDDKNWPIAVGQRVEVPFGRKNHLATGFCVACDIKPEKSFAGRDAKRKLKTVRKLIDKEPLLDTHLMELAQWISSYYVCPLGQILAAMVPSAVKKGVGIKKQKHVYLTIDPENITQTIDQLRGKKQKQIIEFLHKNSAYSFGTAVSTSTLLAKVGCTNEPVRKLAEKLILKTAEKAILKSLPAIPEGMSIKTQPVVLNEDQQKAMDHINGEIQKERFGVTLLHGVTDSGKTELYIRAVESVLQKNKHAIVLLPEIALTAQTVQRFSDRFENVAVMHSRLTAAQRNDQWHKIKLGKADVVIGARSAVFAPLPNVGLIVVDEEHEPSYKQDTVPRYNGRDVAIKRAQLANAHCILGSATPSLETLLNCKSRKHFSIVCLPKRVMDLPAPQMRLVDLRSSYSTQKGINLLSEPLTQHLKEALTKNEQAILFLNRRGYSNFVFCPSCKHILQCRNCDVTLTFHKSEIQRDGGMRSVKKGYMDYGHAMCHHCGSQTLVPKKCPLCGKGMAMIGLGSQRLEEELNHKLPQARIARVDSDSMAGRDYYRVLKDFGDGNIDILAGTQMLAKGLHFPNVTVVGVISADTSLYLPDFRSNERTFQLISQVAGRAGRSEKKGVVFVQTFLPEQPAIQFALRGDFQGFVNEELKHRKACNLPPFWRLAVIVMRDANFDRLEAAARGLRERMDMLVDCNDLKIKVRGPMPATISRIQRFHRMQIIIQAPQAATILSLFSQLRTAPPIRPAVKVAIDIDPVNLL